MTAEMGMLNKYAVALAADSAVTVSQNGESKVYNSANKLFQLSNTEPIGIMIYGNASFMGIPWETIIKLYRNQLNNQSFNLLENYAENFLNFLIDFKIPEENQQYYIEQSFFNLLRNFYGDIQDSEKTITLNEWIKDYDELFSSEYEQVHHIPQKDILLIKSEFIPQIIDYFKKEQENDELIKHIDLTSENENQIGINFFNLLIKFITINRVYNSSGIVIAGFGNEEIYPSLYSFDIEGKIGKTLISLKLEDVRISQKNKATIIPFAQTSMIKTFIQGINPNLESDMQKEISTNLNKMTKGISETIATNLGLSEEIEENLQKEFQEKTTKLFLDTTNKFLSKYKQQNHIVPIINAVAMLEKNDLAHMAESLVNIVSMDKKMSMEIESVGGPIDVAVISKGDGFIWYKRKHYFEPNLNPNFMARKGKIC